MVWLQYTPRLYAVKIGKKKLSLHNDCHKVCVLYMYEGTSESVWKIELEDVYFVARIFEIHAWCFPGRHFEDLPHVYLFSLQVQDFTTDFFQSDLFL